MWFALASATGLAVVRDTAAGCDEIQSWPDLAFLDWITEPFYVFNSICVGLLPGIGFAWYAGKSLQVDEATAVGIFILFPIAFCRCLNGTRRSGRSRSPVYQTFWMAWRGWTAFYFRRRLWWRGPAL